MFENIRSGSLMHSVRNKFCAWLCRLVLALLFVRESVVFLLRLELLSEIKL